MEWINNKTLLSPTGGFLKGGFTHTVNIYSGCSFARAVCGTFCYARHIPWTTKGRPWGLYGAKSDINRAYQKDYDRIKHPRKGLAKPLKIYMSSITDPYLPQEKFFGLTASLLEEMIARPPDLLVLQTHSVLIQRDLPLIKALSRRSKVRVSMTVETDWDPLPGFPPHTFPPLERLETLEVFKGEGIPTQTTVSPLLPLKDPVGFARSVAKASDRVILDHFLIGDGSNGRRTLRTDLIPLLNRAGFSDWGRLEKLWEIREIFSSVLGPDNTRISEEGFNSV